MEGEPPEMTILLLAALLPPLFLMIKIYKLDKVE